MSLLVQAVLLLGICRENGRRSSMESGGTGLSTSAGARLQTSLSHACLWGLGVTASLLLPTFLTKRTRCQANRGARLPLWLATLLRNLHVLRQPSRLSCFVPDAFLEPAGVQCGHILAVSIKWHTRRATRPSRGFSSLSAPIVLTTINGVG